VFDEIEAFFNGDVGFAIRAIHEEKSPAKPLILPKY